MYHKYIICLDSKYKMLGLKCAKLVSSYEVRHGRCKPKYKQSYKKNNLYFTKKKGKKDKRFCPPIGQNYLFFMQLRHHHCILQFAFKYYKRI